MGHSPPRRGVINSGNKWQEKNLTNEANVDDKKPKNSVMQMNLDEALGTIESQRELDRVNALNRDLTAQLEEVNKVLEGQENTS